MPAAIGAAFAFVACSSSSGRPTGAPDAGGTTCPPISACGGDVVGTWRVTQSCVSGTQDLSSICPGATAEIDLAIDGTATFNADGTYTSMPIAGPVMYHEHFPSGCMPYGKTCAEIGQSLADAGTASGSCSTDSAGDCNCDATAQETANSQTGTYSMSGGMLTLVHDGTTSTATYCVRGNTLSEMAGPGDGGLITAGTVVLTKQ